MNMNTGRIVVATAPIVLAAPLGMVSLSNIEIEKQFAWSENTGWTVWQHDTPNPGDHDK